MCAVRKIQEEIPLTTKPEQVLVIATGGTIDKSYPKTAGAYGFEIGPSQAGSLLGLAQVSFDWRLEAIIGKDSQDITQTDREELLAFCIDCPEIKIIITHGTDTMVETAQYLQTAKIPSKTIILTGAWQPSRLTESDAAFNLGSAVIALNTLPSGVYVVMQGRAMLADTCQYRSNFRQFVDLTNPWVVRDGIPIEDLHFSTRTYNCLKKGNIFSLGDLARTSESDLSIFRNLGPGCMREIREKLSEFNLRLCGDEDEEDTGEED